MNSQYCSMRGWFRPSCRSRAATVDGLARWPRMVSAGLPGIRWTMKNVMIVTPTAVGTSRANRRRTKLMRPMQASARSAAEPDVFHVVVAERRHVEPVHVGGLRVGVGRVVQERHEGVARRRLLGGVVVRLPGRGGRGHLGVL